ncbi:MAG TPA: SprB repeat-containing protein [Saprospiraceae bacterium]|nr:SprB repeat-containing protein [Saprospiraceae bacterium]
MKKIGLPLILWCLLLLAGQTHAQSLVCNDLVQIALDNNCTFTMQPEDMLEGTIFPNCIVEIDKVLPLGNGPWVPAVFGPADAGKTYQARVSHLPSGNKCWGHVKLEDKLPPVLDCTGVTNIDLNTANPATIAATALNIDAFEPCGAYSFTPASFQYDCTDLGVNIVQLTATDAIGNTSTCLHTVLVSGTEACSPCVSQCPDPVTLTYDEGNNQLLPEFQNNNWAAFDTYGDALFSSNCTYIDSTYFVDYQVGTAGQSWFNRQWVWVDGGGQFITCQQIISFPTTHKVTISGEIYLDGNDNCTADPTDQRVNVFPLILTLQPSGATQSVPVNANGSYSTSVVFDVNTTDAWLSLQLPSGVNPVCASAINVQNSTINPTVDFDFGIQTNGDCPKMQVDLGDVFLRKCSQNAFYINYCNTGLDTAFGAFVTLDLDPSISFVSADISPTVSGPDSIYTFQLGNVPPFFCGSFRVISFVSCNTVLGQTLCNEVQIFPDVPCSGAWQGPKIEANAQCEGDSVSLTLKNVGIQDMSSQLNYIVVEDFIMYKDGNFQLNAGETLTIKTPANGAAWRIEADQVPGYPEVITVAAGLEGCGGTNNPGVILSLGQPLDPPTSDEHCGPVLASCDPNDKTAIPTGITADNIIRANQPLDYKIRFQNTGNDTAFKVVIVDTLSNLLNAQTLEVGASSHPYRVEIYPGNILHFVFDPIALPDSNVNEVESHGFVNFRIQQQPDLPDGTVIENQVAIYFDKNEPVFTNIAFHTIGYPFIPNPPLAVSSVQQNPSCAGLANGEIEVVVNGGVPPYNYQWSDPNLQGNLLTDLPAGTYQVTITDSYRGEWVNSFTLDEPAQIEITTSATPSTGTADNGTASAVVTGGTGSFTYLWNNGETNASIVGLPAGVYSVTVTDAGGCTAVESTTVAFIPAMVFSSIVSNPPLCTESATGSITVTVTGGTSPYTYTWHNPIFQGNTLNNLPAGSYDLTVTDHNGNTLTAGVELLDPAPVLLQMASTPHNAIPHNGTASVTASGGTGQYSYVWNTGATDASISGLQAGSYTVTVTDSNGCTRLGTVTVDELVATGEPFLSANIKVWPNPAHDQLTIELKQALPELLSMDILAADGRVLQRFQASQLQPVMQLELGKDTPSGLILLVFHARNGSIATETVVKHD